MLLKGCFRHLRGVYFHDTTTICKLIFAGCVLHNLWVLNDDEVDHYMDNHYMDMDDALHQLTPSLVNVLDAIMWLKLAWTCSKAAA